MEEVVEFLNKIQGRPFFGEDCTMFIERAFGKRRMFGDSPTARALGFGMRVGDPALALLKPNVAAGFGRRTPSASRFSARVARSNGAMGFAQRLFLDSSGRGMDAVFRSRGRHRLPREEEPAR